MLCLVNNAGTNKPAKLIDTNLEDFDHVMSLNVRSVMNLTKHVVRKMIENEIKGSILMFHLKWDMLEGQIGQPIVQASLL
mgnify:CR=1 FL=1